MQSTMICGLQFWFSFLIAVDAVVIPARGRTQLTKNRYLGNAKNQVSERCDLMCPGQPPLSLPSNFFHTCTPSSSGSVHVSYPTTEKSTTTTESSEEESSESEETNDKKTSTKVDKRQRFHNKESIQRRNHTISHKRQMRRHLKHRIKKKTVIFKREAKNRLFKHYKQLKERWRLDGCYVICSDGNEGSSGNGVSQGSDVPFYGGSNSDESSAEDNNFVEGGDTPIEIIYIPGDSRRQYETYQVNNYGLDLLPIPPIDFGYDPLFIEGKQNTIKKRRQYSRRKEKKKKVRKQRTSQ